ncbi:excalibur calcium-binding domain-containing protein [Peribacillus sp. NPDC058075]|uniref:excalibur calcium-binding domain-containing protein n=1 Tax=unclassified Peribacillus TaxID=2675266 RepID=UPI0036DF0452
MARNKRIGVWSIPGYAHVDQEHGFNSPEKVTPKPVPKPVAPKPAPKPAPAPTPEPGTEPEPEAEFFQNCTDLRTKYPDGVPADHPAYQAKMDRDKDNYACER